MSNNTHSQATERATVTAREAAAMVGISERHLYQLESLGKLGPRRMQFGRAVRWSRRELLDWIDAGAPASEEWQRIRAEREEADHEDA